MSLETWEIKLFGRDIPGFCRDIPEAPESLRKKCLGSIFGPYMQEKFGPMFRSLEKLSKKSLFCTLVRQALFVRGQRTWEFEKKCLGSIFGPYLVAFQGKETHLFCCLSLSLVSFHNAGDLAKPLPPPTIKDLAHHPLTRTYDLLAIH